MMVAMALLTANCSIKTGIGVSEGTCLSTASQPAPCPGQGSRLASALHVIISHILFSLMEKFVMEPPFTIQEISWCIAKQVTNLSMM
jgi:hypothetical protein